MCAWSARRYLGLVLIAAGQACAQRTAIDWFPAHLGDKWIYGHDTRDENGEGRSHLVTHSWKTEETTTGSWAVPEGTLLEKQVRVTEGSAPAGWWVNPNAAYLIRGDCLYSEASWDPSAHKLTADFLKGIGAYLSPDLCFSLVTQKVWGAPHGLPDWGVTRPEEARDWQVVGITARDKQKTLPAPVEPKIPAPVEPKIKAIAFDALTVFDLRPIAVLAERLFPGRGEQMSALWRTRQFEYT